MNKRPHTSPYALAALQKIIGLCVISLLSFTMSAAYANNGNLIASAIDVPISANKGLSKQELGKQIKKEQAALAKQDRKELKKLAVNGERLAQVVLGSDFASEAQMLTFAPAAANDALSDALQWYSLAAKRGFPGAPSLDTSGVSFYPVRVVRNK